MLISTPTRRKVALQHPLRFGIYMIRLTMKWLLAEGGLGRWRAATAGISLRRARRLRRLLPTRSPTPVNMSATFRLPSEELEKRFVAEAKAAGLRGSRAATAQSAATRA
jgi:phosphoserine aminotransferase